MEHYRINGVAQRRLRAYAIAVTGVLYGYEYAWACDGYEYRHMSGHRR